MNDGFPSGVLRQQLVALKLNFKAWRYLQIFLDFPPETGDSFQIEIFPKKFQFFKERLIEDCQIKKAHKNILETIH